MDRVRITYYKEKEILILDYSDLWGDAMIGVFEEAKNLILSRNEQVVVLSMFNSKSYVSRAFIRHIEKEIGKTDLLISKQAVVGLSTIKTYILRGINMWYKKQIYNFSSVEEAMTFLTDD